MGNEQRLEVEKATGASDPWPQPAPGDATADNDGADSPLEAGASESRVAEAAVVDAPDTHAHDVDATDADGTDADAGDTDTQAAAEKRVDPGDGGHELTTEQVIEAILFAADTPLTPAKIVSLLGVGSARDVRNYVESLNKRYAAERAAFRIEKLAGGYQMLTLPAYNTWIRRLKQSRQDSRLSPAAMETLAVVAYKQPVVRADIEAIRGVSAGEMLNRLRELGLIRIVGRAEDVGRPMLYGTTKRFLEILGLGSLDDLPEVEELQPGQ